MTHYDHETCRRLLDSLESMTDTDEVERIIAAHRETCPVCADEERRLGDLIAAFSQSDQSLPPDLEERLLNRLCPPS